MNTMNKIAKTTTLNAFSDVLKSETMVYVSNNLGFAIFDGVMAGTIKETDSGEHLCQSYSKGDLLVIKTTTDKSAYHHIRAGTTYRMSAELDLRVIGFTAHASKENSCMVHMWCDSGKEKTFYRATGVNLMKHLDSPRSPFECVRSKQPDSLEELDDAIIASYYRTTESVLKMESEFFSKLPLHSRSETLSRLRDQEAEQAKFDEDAQEEEHQHKLFMRRDRRDV